MAHHQEIARAVQLHRLAESAIESLPAHSQNRVKNALEKLALSTSDSDIRPLNTKDRRDLYVFRVDDDLRAVISAPPDTGSPIVVMGLFDKRSISRFSTLTESGTGLL